MLSTVSLSSSPFLSSNLGPCGAHQVNARACLERSSFTNSRWKTEAWMVRSLLLYLFCQHFRTNMKITGDDPLFLLVLFFCSSVHVIWPNQSHIKEVAGIWKHLYGNSKMVPRYFEQLADWASENVLRFFDSSLENVPVDLPLCLWQMIFTRNSSINTVSSSSSSSFSDHGPGSHQRSLCHFRAFAKFYLLLQFEIVSKKRAAVVVVAHV